MIIVGEQIEYPNFDYCLAGSNVWEKDKHYHRNDIPYFLHISAVYKGTIEVKSDGNIYTIEKNMFYLSVEGRKREILFSKKERTWETWIDYFLKNPTEKDINLVRTLPIKMPISLKLRKTLEAVSACSPASIQRSSQNDIFLRALAESVLVGIFSELEQQKNPKQDEHPLVLRKIIDFVDEYCHLPLSIKQIAECCGISTGYLILIMRRNNYPSPMDFVYSKRIERALTLLSSTDMKIKDIAEQTGFLSASHFSRKIKEVTGKTPLMHKK